jgi:hypothetical protein
MTYKVTLYHPHSYPNVRTEVKKWLELHCKSYDASRSINMVLVAIGGSLYARMDYFFENEKDAVLFSLRWA